MFILPISVHGWRSKPATSEQYWPWDTSCRGGRQEKPPEVSGQGHELAPSVPSLHQGGTSQGMRQIGQRDKASCGTPSTGADEDDLPYMQLDKVTHAVSRETFGPLYLVTWFSRWVIRDLALWCLWWSCCQVALPFSELKEDSELLWSCDILFHRFIFFSLREDSVN